MNDEHILQIKESFETDESIRRYDYNEYLPIAGTSYNTAGEIRIILESQDEFFHPSNSYLVIEGQVVKENGTAYDTGDKISLINNGPMYLFSNIKYELSGHEIESINYPGPATTMKGLLKYSDDYAKGQGMNQCWTKDAHTGEANQTTNEGFKVRQGYIIEKPTPKGTFSFAIPFTHIFGFAEDYDRVTYGMRQGLTMVRQGDNDAIFKDGGVDAGKVVLSKISWHMPRVFPNDVEKFKLMKTIEAKTALSVGFRMYQCDTISVNQSTTFSWSLSAKTSPECPRWVYVAFQTDKAAQQDKNPAIFDHCNAEDVWLELNGIPYPSLRNNTDFAKMRFAALYNSIASFLPNYYGITSGQQSNISPVDFASLYPLHIIDLTKQPERIKHGVMNMTLRGLFREAVKAKTQAYIVIASDRILTFQSDGNKMNVTY